MRVTSGEKSDPATATTLGENTMHVAAIDMWYEKKGFWIWVANSCAEVGHFWTPRDMGLNTSDSMMILRLVMESKMSLDQLCPVPLLGGLGTECPTLSN